MLLPGDDVVYVFGEVLNEEVPPGLVPFLPLEEQVGEQHPILPVAAEGLREELGVMLEDSE